METALLLKPKEVADALQISVWRVRQMVHNGELPALRVGNLIRIPADDLKRWIKEHKDGGNGKEQQGSA